MWTGRAMPTYLQLRLRRMSSLQTELDLAALPLIAGLHQNGADQAQADRPVRENTDPYGSAFDLADYPPQAMGCLVQTWRDWDSISIPLQDKLRWQSVQFHPHRSPECLAGGSGRQG
jgi:hypothetical protein